MQDIKKAIFTTIRDDSTIRTLLGYTSSDPRIYYSWSPEEHKINATYPAYITYFIPIGNPTNWNRENEIYTISIYSENPDTNESIFNRLDSILHNQILTDTNDNYITNLTRVSQMDSFDEDENIYIKSLNYSAVSIHHTDLSAVVADDGGTYIDETTAGSNDISDDMTLLPSVPVVNDAYYFGHTEIFSRLYIDISTTGVGNWTIVWEYYNGTSWTSLDNLIDGTSGFTNSDINSISFTANNSWRKTNINSLGNYFYIRARVSIYGSITTQPLGKMTWI